jgi:hypothetical protein
MGDFTMTEARIEAAKATAESWSDENPFKASLLKRLEVMGGQYAPSQTADRRTALEQPRVDHARETAEAHAEGGCAF